MMTLPTTWAHSWCTPPPQKRPSTTVDVSAPVGPGTPYWPVAKSPRLKVPQMPQMPWTGTAPIGSSIRTHSRRSTASTMITPAMAPMMIEPVG